MLSKDLKRIYGTTPTNLLLHTRAELVEMAQKMKLTGISSLTKQELVKQIKKTASQLLHKSGAHPKYRDAVFI